ncbi:MAG: hypothetical protein ABEN55_04395, partial [Bradymonadaceae bacterium]
TDGETPPDTFFARHRLPGGTTIERRWQTRRRGDRLYVYDHSELRTLMYRFRIDENGAQELTSASVRAFG